MILERNLSKFIVFSEDTLLNAMRKINANKSRIVFCVSASGELEGVLTDGDVRRWITNTPQFNIDISVNEVANKEYFSLPQDASHGDIERSFSERIDAIPLVNRHRQLVAIARRGATEIRIGNIIISSDSPSFLIAEIGNNHNGQIELAYQLTDKAIAAGADCVKFQMRNMRELFRNSGDANDLSEDLGAQYTLDLLSRFQLKNEELFRVFDYCKSKGILPLCTPWDVESLEVLDRYGMLAYKVASADLTNHALLESIAKTGKPLICSTGMSSENEIMDSVRVLRRMNSQFVLLHCNSTYPAPFKDIHLNYLDRLRQIGGCEVGYSGHERGVSVVMAAIAKGAKVIEKHITLDRSMEGNDHRVSLLPEEFLTMVQGIREVEQAMGKGEVRRITQGEMMNREVLAKSLVASCHIPAGIPIQADMIEIRSPGKGLSPYRRNDLINKIARREIQAGDFFYPSDLEEANAVARHYSFKRPFGIPVRYHDINRMVALSNFDLLEFHLSYKDLDVDPAKYIEEKKFDMDLVVHSPELFYGDHIMDLCSPDPVYRRHSIDELQRVVNVTRTLAGFFRTDRTPLLIINAGGFSLDKPLTDKEREGLYELIAESLSQVNSQGVEIIPQSMPPFPWHFGGQRYHNLFMTADDIVNFCTNYNYRICLDLSHSQLACNHFGHSFKDFLDKVGSFSAHLHVVDADGVDGEGLQIGQGKIDFSMVADVLSRVAPNASFIPEIWQGHKNNGAGFWEALDKLEKWF